MKYIDPEKLIAEIERRLKIVEPHKDTFESAAACRQELIWMKEFITSLQQEQPMPDSTQLIEFWNEDKEMLKEKDFRNDAWRLAYNAFMCGFVRGVSVKKQEQKCIFGNTPSEDVCLVCSAACPLRVPKTKVSTSTEITAPSGQADELTFEEYLRGVFEINNGIENDPDNLVRIHAPELLKLARKQEQQKGLHFTPLNRLIQKIPSEKWNDNTNNYAKKLRDCLIKEGYLKDANVLQGYISYMNGNNIPMATMDEQEQPEVDFETEYAKFTNDPDALEYAFPIDLADYKDFARHFYELGLKARKEE